MRTDRRKHFLTQHVVSLWNSLPQDVVMASGLDAFKGDWTDSWRKNPSKVTSHDGDVESPGLKGRDLQMPDAGEGYQKTGI